jgi:hypothetical protein
VEQFLLQICLEITRLRPRPKVVFSAYKLDIVGRADGTRHLVGALFGHLVFLFLEIYWHTPKSDFAGAKSEKLK